MELLKTNGQECMKISGNESRNVDKQDDTSAQFEARNA